MQNGTGKDCIVGKQLMQNGTEKDCIVGKQLMQNGTGKDCISATEGSRSRKRTQQIKTHTAVEKFLAKRRNF
ncbi:hypothetical protein [Methanolapillus africanus]|uniref:hypothetical protein n=1 Tax=Methanolapillus africanus TaxID=3028297 RepID=UPI0030B8F3C5